MKNVLNRKNILTAAAVTVTLLSTGVSKAAINVDLSAQDPSQDSSRHTAWFCFWHGFDGPWWDASEPDWDKCRR